MGSLTPEVFLRDFLEEAHELVTAVEQGLLHLKDTPKGDRAEALEEIRRDLHTLKGNAGMVGLAELQQLAHTLEDRSEDLDLDRLAVQPLLEDVDHCRRILVEAAEMGEAAARVLESRQGSVRVPFSALDALVDQLAETVIFRNRLADAIGAGARLSGDADRELWRETELAEEALGKTLDELRRQVMSLRLVPLESLFGRLRRIVHDESLKAGKEVDLEIRGGDTPIDKALLELASEALGHTVRNAVIHGIEETSERLRRGKPPQGRIRLTAESRGEELRIVVEDDGGGIDREALRHLAARRGLSDDPERLLELIFLPGVSTKEGADLSSGRGIGLSAVQESVRRQGGRIEVESAPGQGTRFSLELPLVVSITLALLVRVDGEDYALPLAPVLETLALTPEISHEINHAGVLRWRDGVLPLVDLGCLFGTAATVRREGFVVALEVGGRRRGLAVDTLEGVREIVVKSLDPLVGRPQGIAGSTILGDGRAVLILDPPDLMQVAPFVRKSA